jgi:uncharacterized protein (UPF0248 family)
MTLLHRPGWLPAKNSGSFWRWENMALALGKYGVIREIVGSTTERNGLAMKLKRRSIIPTHRVVAVNQSAPNRRN